MSFGFLVNDGSEHLRLISVYLHDEPSVKVISEMIMLEIESVVVGTMCVDILDNSEILANEASV